MGKKKSKKLHKSENLGLGWDITDFCSGSYKTEGLLLFTLRNGIIGDPSTTVYAQKLLLVDEDQVTPFHYHWQKTEDIINQAGGVLMMQLYKAATDNSLSSESFKAIIDGEELLLQVGEIISLNPGSSITPNPFIYHVLRQLKIPKYLQT
ncbi:MAG: D-lyxose/D-mannose family sugar isomerase [Bacteroidetes bacterium]|nr:D-lyxose/D-mannose family sugar isomerase [Bacteroidota bacterium]